MQNEELNVSCRTNSSDCNVDDLLDIPAEDFESSPSSLQPRKLSFTDTDLADSLEITGQPAVNNNSVKTSSVTDTIGMRIPIRDSGSSQRLFDSPATSKTILETCVTLPTKCTTFSTLEKPRPCSYQNKPEKPAANVSPFTPSGMLLTARKRTRSGGNLNSFSDIEIPKFELADSEDSDNDVKQATKRVALQDSNILRYHQEFDELGLIGRGEFGSIYKCIHKLDGCTYAIKKSTKPITDSINETNALNQLHAQAVLGKHKHVVRYFSSWLQNNHMIIQNEYCNSGSLAEVIEDLQDKNQKMSEPELRQLLLHTVKGLQYIHKMQLAHQNIKPSNIFISKENRLPALNNDSADVGFGEKEITYKIGDLDCATSIKNPQVRNGDSRYLSPENIFGNFTQLPKADIFALGLTVYEAGGGGPLPKGGAEYYNMRNDNLKKLSHYSRDFNDVLKLMITADPEMRPSAVSLTQHPFVLTPHLRAHAQLQQKLKIEKTKINMLTRQIQEVAKCFKTISPNLTAMGNTLNRIGGYNLRSIPTSSSTCTISRIGRRRYRSSSTSNM